MSVCAEKFVKGYLTDELTDLNENFGVAVRLEYREYPSGLISRIFGHISSVVKCFQILTFVSIVRSNESCEIAGRTVIFCNKFKCRF